MNKENQKHLYVNLTIQDGERSYQKKIVTKVDKEAGNTVESHNIARDLYEGECEVEDGGYYFLGGQIHVSVLEVKEITEKEFDILKKFL